MNWLIHFTMLLVVLLGLVLRTASYAFGFVVFPITFAHYGLQRLAIYLIESESRRDERN
jgi:hypothetical protein